MVNRCTNRSARPRPWAELTCVFCREVLVPVYCTSGSVLMLVLCIPKIDFVYAVSIPKDCFVSAVYPKDHGSRHCTQGTKIWGCPNPPPRSATDVQHLVTRSRPLLSVLDTLPQGGGQRVGGWVGGLFPWFLGSMDPPPPGGWVGVGFCWVLGLRAFECRPRCLPVSQGAGPAQRGHWRSGKKVRGPIPKPAECGREHPRGPHRWYVVSPMKHGSSSATCLPQPPPITPWPRAVLKNPPLFFLFRTALKDSP